MSVILAMLLSPVLWSTPVDSRISDQWMAQSAGRVYVNRFGHLSAIETEHGNVVWVAGMPATSAPAYLRGTLAAPTSAGVVFLNGTTGAIQSIYHLDGDASVARGQRRIVVVKYGAATRNAAFGFDRLGRLQWRVLLPRTSNVSVTQLRGNAVLVQDFDRNTALVLDAATGNAVAQANYVNDLVGVDGRMLWFTIVGGGIEGLNLDTNREVIVRNNVIPRSITVEHSSAVAVIDGRLRLLNLADGTSQPLHIDGRWIGGPIAGAMLIERGDGLYVRGLDGNRARRIAQYTAESRAVASNDGAVAYVGLRDGTIFAIDMRQRRLLETVATPCRYYEGFTTVGSKTLVHCDEDSGRSQIVAFSAL